MTSTRLFMKRRLARHDVNSCTLRAGAGVPDGHLLLFGFLCMGAYARHMLPHIFVIPDGAKRRSGNPEDSVNLEDSVNPEDSVI
jgi:hypothetical protein